MRFGRKPAALLLLLSMLLTGCTSGSVDRLYCLPKRSEAHRDLQLAIDAAMGGMEYSAPRSGENLQAVQVRDLDGDGKGEYLLFAKKAGDRPLQILIFRPTADGYALSETIETYGTAFDRVEYANIDGKPGYELIVGRRLSDQVIRAVSVYSFAEGQSALLTTDNYTHFTTCDLDGDGNGELLVFKHGEAAEQTGVAVYYSYRDGIMERSAEVSMSAPTENVKRILVGWLADNRMAVFAASTVEENAIVTDVFSVVDGKFTNLTLSGEAGNGVGMVRNYYVYADDIDNDGVTELPELISMRPLSESESPGDSQYLIRWYALRSDGTREQKLYTYHNYESGWYISIQSDWAQRLTIVQDGTSYGVYLWNADNTESEKLLTVYAFSGQDRETQAVSGNRFLLYEGDTVQYAAELEVAAVRYGVTKDRLIRNFHLIQQDWKTGET